MAKNVEFTIKVDAKKARIAQERIEQGFEDIETQVERTDRDIRGMSGGFDKVKAGAMALGAAGAAAVAAIGRRALRVGAKFNQMQKELSAITGIVGDDLEQMSQAALQMSEQYGTSASDVVEAQKLVASQLAEKIDFSTQEGVDQLNDISEQALVLQKAAGTDLKTAVEATSSAINQFGLEASEANRVVNVLAAGSKFGAAEVGAQARAFEEAGSAANMVGESIETTNAAIQVLAQNAIRGSKAGTGLRNVFSILASESDKLAEQGIKNVDIESDGLIATLEKLKPLSSDTVKLTEIFGREAANTASILIRNAGTVSSLNGKITGTNVATEQAATQMESWSSSVDRLAAAFDANLIQAFEDAAPWMSEIVDFTADLISNNDGLSNEYKSLEREVSNLTSKAPSLIKQYQTLSEKTNLSTGEQEQLDTVINRLDTILPAATKKFDKYGNTIGINAEKSKEYVKQQKEILRSQNAAEYEEQAEKLKSVEGQYDLATKALKQLQETGEQNILPRLSGDEVQDRVKKLGGRIKGLLSNIEDLGFSVEDTAQISEQLFGIEFGKADFNTKELAERVGFMTQEMVEGSEKTEENTEKTDDNTDSKEDNTDATEEQSDATQTLSEKRKAVNDQIEKYLNKTGTLTDAEKRDLAILTQQNEQLEKQVRFRKKRAEVRAQEASGSEGLEKTDVSLTGAFDDEEGGGEEGEEGKSDGLGKMEGLEQAAARHNKQLDEMIQKTKQAANQSGNMLGLTQEGWKDVASQTGQATKEVIAYGGSAKEIMATIIRASINAALAKAINAAVQSSLGTGPAALFVAPALIGTAVALVNAATSSLLDFEQGGMIPSAQDGGMLRGPRHSQGGIKATMQGGGAVELEGDEFIVNRRSTRESRELLEEINSGAGKARQVQAAFQGGMSGEAGRRGRSTAGSNAEVRELTKAVREGLASSTIKAPVELKTLDDGLEKQKKINKRLGV